MNAIKRNKLLLATLIMTLMYSFHYGIPLYTSSSFLHQFFSTGALSAIYMVASVITLIISIHLTKYVRKYHTYKFTISLIIANILATLIFALSKNIYIIATFFIVHFCVSALAYIMLSMFIENLSIKEETGMVRGLFLTLLNFGILVSPFIGAALLSRGGFTSLYMASILSLIPLIFFLKRYFQHMPDPAYHSIDMINAGVAAFKNINLRGALISVLLLECFYAVMVIHSPIYLSSIGIDLKVYLSIILPIALIPFVIMPYELGIIADNKLGEKELMILGLVLMALTTLSIVVIDSKSILVWIFIFILSRIGAACVETMTFTYYFKKINPEDASLVALFGNMRSMAIIIVGAFGAIMAPLLMAYPGFIFIILGLALLSGVTFVLPIRDTK